MTEQERADLYRDYYGKVRGYLQARVRNEELAEDLAADVFLKAYERLEGFDESKASLSTWIFTITRNTLTDYYRTRRVYDEIPETLDDDSSVEEDVCNAETLKALSDALKQLDERERDIVILRYYSGKTLKEIGEKMDISYAYVKVLHNKALATLKKYLE